MSYATDRLMLFDRLGNPLGDLSPDDLLGECPLFERVNGEHALTIKTTRVLAEGTCVVFCDGTGRWREYAVNAPDELHARGEHAEGTYGCVWSLQYDLTRVTSDGHPEPGMGDACSGRAALSCALEGTDRWAVGTVDVPAVEAGKGVVMIGKSAWDRLKLVVGAWHGEADAEIEVGPSGVTSRRVALLSHLGATTVTRRFDWTYDLKSIRRTPDPGPYYCGILPLGRGHTEYAEDGETTIDWPLMLTDDPEHYPEHTSNFLYDQEASAAFRVPDGRGGWEYPVKPVRYETDDVGELYDLAIADLHDQTHPRVTYDSDVLQLARAGMNAQGVGLGDEVQAVDYGFNPGSALRVQGRVMEMTVPLNAPASETRLVIGGYLQTMADELGSLLSSAFEPLSRRVGQIEAGGTIVYLRTLLDYLNEQINATGGYVYVTSGQGLLTYDRAVSDPLVGREATKVVEVKGGSVRIADSRKANGDWDWKTVFVSGHVLAELVTAANIVAGYIRNADETLVIDLDAGTMTFKRGTIASANGKSEWNLTKSTFKSDGGTFTNATVTGKVTAHEGEIGGFTLAESAMYTNSKSSMSSNRNGVYVGSDGIALGKEKFKVTSAGQMECDGATVNNATINDADMYRATVRGAIYATSGEIGGLTLDSSSMYSGRMSHTSNSQGIYIDGDGVSVGDGSYRMALREGVLEGGESYSANGYVKFDTLISTTNDRGARIGGRGGIFLSTNGPLVVSRWASWSSAVTGTMGQSGSVRISNDYNDVTLTFEKGLMVTAI